MDAQNAPSGGVSLYYTTPLMNSQGGLLANPGMIGTGATRFEQPFLTRVNFYEDSVPVGSLKTVADGVQQERALALATVLNRSAAEADLRYAQAQSAVRMYLQDQRSISEQMVRSDMPAPYDVGATMAQTVFADTAEQQPNLPRQEASAVDAYVAGPGIIEGARRAARAMYDTLY